MSVIENINEFINIFDELINQNIIIYPTSLIEMYNCMNKNHYNYDDNFIKINYRELLNRGLFLVKNNIHTKIITDYTIGNFLLISMDYISINIMLTHRENINNDDDENNNNDGGGMNFCIKSCIRKRNYTNGYGKFRKK